VRRAGVVGTAAAALVAAGGGLAFAAAGDRISRDEAAAQAHRELEKGIYHADDPSPLEQAYDWVIRHLNRAFESVSARAPGGALGLLLLVAVLGLGVGFALWRAGPLRRGMRRDPLLSTVDGTWTARQYRDRAAQLQAAGRHAEAIREWLRASARDLEERGVLDPRPGRTADEVAAEAAAQVPEVADALGTAARIFDEVWYGGRTATPELATRLRAADGAVQRASLAVIR
jgi:Domain of unknown function (DUF4129)